MFYTMIRDLQTSHFALPMYTSYNHAQIPFAYPPFGLYFAGLLNVYTGISLLEIIKWQPVIVNIMIIPFFYFFVRRLLGKNPEAALATLIFVLTPNSYWWQIVGGGLTRSWGALFFLLTAYSASQMYQNKNPLWTLFTILAGSLAVLSHLVWALQAGTVSLLFWIYWGRNRQGIFKSIAVIAGIMLVTSPWWVTILQRYGIDVFYIASKASHSPLLFWAPIISLSFTGEYTCIIALLAIIGLFIHMARKDYLPVIWMFLILIVDSRGGVSATVLPASILATTTISKGIAPLLVSTREGSNDNAKWVDSFKTSIGSFFWGFLIILLLYNAFNYSSVISSQFLGSDELDALQWVGSHTTPDARFLVLEWESNWAYSSFSEWFPALTGRRSIATVQGTEWITGENGFLQQIKRFDESHLCLYGDVSCLELFKTKTAIQFDYVVLSLKVPGGDNHQSSLLVSLENSVKYQMVYSSPTVMIFRALK